MAARRAQAAAEARAAPWRRPLAPLTAAPRRADKEVVMAAVQQDGRALQYAAEPLRADRKVVLAAVQQNGGALEHFEAYGNRIALLREADYLRGLPKLGRKAMLGMMEGHEVARLDTAMVQREGRHALMRCPRPTRRRRCSGQSSPIDCPIVVLTSSTRNLRSCVQGSGGWRIEGWGRGSRP